MGGAATRASRRSKPRSLLRQRRAAAAACTRRERKGHGRAAVAGCASFSATSAHAKPDVRSTPVGVLVACARLARARATGDQEREANTCAYPRRAVPRPRMPLLRSRRRRCSRRCRRYRRVLAGCCCGGARGQATGVRLPTRCSSLPGAARAVAGATARPSQSSRAVARVRRRQPARRPSPAATRVAKRGCGAQTVEEWRRQRAVSLRAGTLPRCSDAQREERGQRAGAARRRLLPAPCRTSVQLA